MSRASVILGQTLKAIGQTILWGGSAILVAAILAAPFHLLILADVEPIMGLLCTVSFWSLVHYIRWCYVRCWWAQEVCLRQFCLDADAPTRGLRARFRYMKESGNGVALDKYQRWYVSGTEPLCSSKEFGRFLWERHSALQPHQKPLPASIRKSFYS